MEACTGLLKVKYPTARYMPMVGCARCNGTGEQAFERGAVGNPYAHSGTRPCVCLFVSHESVRAVSTHVQTVATTETETETQKEPTL